MNRNWEKPFPKNRLGERTDDEIGKVHHLNQWTRVLKETLQDSRGQVWSSIEHIEIDLTSFFPQQCNVEMREFDVDASVDIRLRYAQHVKVWENF